MKQEDIERHLGLVRHIVKQMCATSPMADFTEFDDLVGAGVIGLIGAVRRFDPERGLSFSTFAAPCIRGAILDDLRSRDNVPRRVRKQGRRLKRAGELQVGARARWPSPVELAKELGITPQKLRQWESEALRAEQVVRLDAMTGEHETATVGDAIVGHDGRDPLKGKALMRRVMRAILALPRQQREVVCMYYMDQMKLREIAAIMHVTEARICQVKIAAVERLRYRLLEAAEGEDQKAS